MISSSIDLPRAIRQFFESSNRGDAVGVRDCFTADAILEDYGRRFTGKSGIVAWDRSDNTGVQARFKLSSIRLEQGVHAVNVTVSGNGYNGDGILRFTLRGNLIARLDIG